MREDEDHFRHYMPVLRRIIILVAVLTAIPVVMWTITAFVRTYVGPPKQPTFQPLAASPVGVAPDEAAAAPADNPPAPAAEDAKAAPLSSAVIARASPTDAGGNTPAGDPNGAGAPAAVPAAAPPVAATPSPSATHPTDTARFNLASSGTTDPTPNPTPNLAAQSAPEQPRAANWPAPPPSAPDALPASEPIAGQVPLPRKRPRSFVVAQAGVPLPRPRPDAAGPVAPDAPPSPLDWLRNIFQPPSAASTPPPSEDLGESPH